MGNHRIYKDMVATDSKSGGMMWLPRLRTAMKIGQSTAAVLLPLFLLLQPVYAEKPKETKTILVLYSEEKGHPAHDLTDRGMMAILGSNESFDLRLYTEYLDMSRFSGPRHLRNLTEYLVRKYSGSQIDVIIAVYPAAVDLLGEETGGTFSDIPIVACEITKSYAERLKSSPMRRRVTGVIGGENLSGVLDTALRMRPGAKHVALIAGTEPNDRYNEEIFRKGLKPYASRLALIDLTGLPMEKIVKRVETLPLDTIILYAALSRDGSGRIFVPREALSRISAAANAPVFSLYDSYLGYGIVGGRLVSFEQQGRVAAELALRVLSGESPASLPFVGQGTYVSLYDWRQLKRWNIPENTVTAGSEIRYRNPSLWEDYGKEILGLTILLMLETALIVGLVRNLRKRRKTERSLIESEHRVRLAVSSAGAGLWSLDMSAGTMWMTDEARKILGLADREMLNFEKFLALVHPEDRFRVRKAMQDTLELKQENRIDYRVVTQAGEIRWIGSVGRVSPEQPGERSVLTGVSIDITQRKQTREKLQESQRELSALAGRLITAQEEERSRFARELHDDFSQRLAVLAIEAGSLELQSGAGIGQDRNKLSTIKTDLIKISQDIHDLSRQLHPSILEDLGLVQAVQSECARLEKKEELNVNFTHEDVPPTIPRHIALALYRIIQAALRNVVLHSQASTAHIALRGCNGSVELLIRDTGIGFDLSQVMGKPGLGIASMKERTKLVNGDFSVDSAPGEGTVITVRLPLDGKVPQ